MRRSRRATLLVLLSSLSMLTSVLVSAPSATAHSATGQPGRAIALSQLGQWGGLDRVARLSYLTTDARGAVVPASGVVRLPDGPRPGDGWPIISWAHGTSGLGEECGLADSEDLIRSTAPVVEALPDAGYAVVATDYIGLGPNSLGPPSYLHTRSEATAVIDPRNALLFGLQGQRITSKIEMVA